MIDNIDTPKFRTQIEEATGTIVGDFATQYLTYIQETPDQWLVKESLADVICPAFIAPSHRRTS